MKNRFLPLLLMAGMAAGSKADIQAQAISQAHVIINNHGVATMLYINGERQILSQQTGLLLACYQGQLFELQVEEQLYPVLCHTMIDIGKGET